VLQWTGVSSSGVSSFDESLCQESTNLTPKVYCSVLQCAPVNAEEPNGFVIETQTQQEVAIVVSSIYESDLSSVL